MKDEDLMPFGVHKGKKMANVPAKYLIWLKEEILKTAAMHRTLNQKNVLKYIDENVEVLNQELKK